MGADDSRQAVAGIIDAWNGKDLDALGEHFADDAVRHLVGLVEHETDLDEYLEVTQVGFETFPDMRVELAHLVVDGDMVAIHIRKAATHQGDIPAGILPGTGPLPGSGRPVGWEEAEFYRMGTDGRIVEYWNHTPYLTIMQQLGALSDNVTG
jgi:predicted ester cyclase